MVILFISVHHGLDAVVGSTALILWHSHRSNFRMQRRNALRRKRVRFALHQKWSLRNSRLGDHLRSELKKKHIFIYGRCKKDKPVIN